MMPIFSHFAKNKPSALSPTYKDLTLPVDEALEMFK